MTTTFYGAESTLRGRTSRKVDNNTYLVRLSNDEIGVRLHNTYVVLYRRNGSIKLNSGGWQTVTTKDRMNKYSPVYVSQKDFEWFVNSSRDGSSHTERYYDGMEVGLTQEVVK